MNGLANGLSGYMIFSQYTLAMSSESCIRVLGDLWVFPLYPPVSVLGRDL